MEGDLRYPRSLGTDGEDGTASESCSFYKSPGLFGLAVQKCYGSILCHHWSLLTLE